MSADAATTAADSSVEANIDSAARPDAALGGGCTTAGDSTDAVAPTQSLVKVRDLLIHASLTGRPLVDGVSFDVAPGEAVGVVGESGSGKSLTLRAIMGLLPEGVTLTNPESAITIAPFPAAAAGVSRGAGATTLPALPEQGETAAQQIGGVARESIRPGASAPSRAPRLAMIFQDPVSSLDPLSGVVRQVAEVLRYNRHLRRREARAQAADLLVSLGLPESLRAADRYPGQLSGGQCQRVGIAIALATNPDILLCDEPTTALDVTVQLQILDLLADLRDRLGLTMLFVTHNLGVAARLCSRLIVMQHGHIVEAGPTEQVLRHPQDEYTRRLVSAVLPIPDAGEVATDMRAQLTDGNTNTGNTSGLSRNWLSGAGPL
ncbi:ABC transporter ATP-binding protein [Bifidobacterium reuteri]|nr:ABC transporter ATP-binding protein [Bifidobacterium reuteri]